MKTGYESLSIEEEQLGEMESFQPPMTRRKLDVLYELKKSGRLSQGELARKMGTRPTALANILLKLDDYSPKLLNKEYEGKYCYYTLSEQGCRLLEENLNLEPGGRVKESSALQDREDEALFQTAQKSVASLKEQYGDDWYEALDDVLIRYVRGSGHLPKEKAKLLAHQYLRSLELLTMHQNDRLRNQTLALLKGSVGFNRVTEFVDTYFVPFDVVLKTLAERNQTLQIHVVLKCIFTEQEDKTVSGYIRDLGWSGDSLQSMKDVIPKIKRCIVGYTLEDIFDYATALLPDQEMLCASISQWLLEIGPQGDAEKAKEP